MWRLNSSSALLPNPATKRSEKKNQQQEHV